MQSVSNFFTLFNRRICLAVAFSVLSVYVSVCNKCVTCLWEVVDRSPLGCYWTVGLLP